MSDFSGVFGALNSLFSLGRMGIGIANTLSNEGNISRARGLYEEQISINQEIASFNAAVTSRAGNMAVANVLRETEQVVGSIKSRAAKRGIDFETTKMFVDAAVTKGIHAAYETAYDTEVKLINLDLQKESMNRKGEANMPTFDVMQRQNTSNLMDQLLGVGNLIATDFSSSVLARRGNVASATAPQRTIERLEMSRNG
jgi:hypothetical protein